MSYRLKSTGIAAHCTMCVAVDPDTGQIKDFASADVTAGITVDSGITIGEQTWAGVPRKYFKLSVGHFVGFGTTKPQMTLNTENPLATVVWIGESAGAAVRVFGDGPNSYFGSQNTGSGGANCPYFVLNSNNSNGLMPTLPAGTKYLFGFTHNRPVGSMAYRALDSAGSMTAAVTPVQLWAGTYPINFIGRRNDSTTQQTDKIHATLIFSAALTETDWDTLRNDWFGALFEAAVSGPAECSTSAATVLPTFAGLASGMAASAATATLSAATVLPVFGGSAAVAPQVATIMVSGLRDLTTGVPRVNETGITAIVSNAATGIRVARLTGQTSDSTGACRLADAAFMAAAEYRVTLILADGSEGTWKYAAA